MRTPVENPDHACNAAGEITALSQLAQDRLPYVQTWPNKRKPFTSSIFSFLSCGYMIASWNYLLTFYLFSDSHNPFLNQLDRTWVF